MRRLRLVLARWFSLICCGIVAGAIVVGVEPVLVRLTAPLADRMAALGPLAATIVTAVLVAAACWFAGARRWRGFLGIRHFFCYPPLWLAMIIGFGAWLGVGNWTGGPPIIRTLLDDALWFYAAVPRMLWLALLGIVVVAVVMPLLPHRRPLSTARSRRRRDSSSTTAGDFDELRAWLSDDSEISTPELDRFGHDQVARRIAGRLQEKNEAPTMAVIGSLGSGKSTIRRLVAYHLRRQPAVRLIDVSLWPFDSAESAVRGILRSLVRELGQHVNILPLVGLSDDYVTAIEKTAGAYGGVARLLRGATDPAQVVARFSEITCAAGLRLVLWVEDLERFSGGDQLEGAARIEREAERLGPIRALLHLLDRCPSISVIVSDTSLRTRFDLGKIARFIEQPPPMDADRVWDVARLLRQRCLGGYPVTVIDPTSAEVRAALVPAKDAHRIGAWLSSFRDSHPSIPAAIAHILRTPRAMKSALRIALETWERSPGEVDLDSVLVASVLRVTRPELFALVSEHIELFREGLTSPFSMGGEKKPHRVVARIDELFSSEDERTVAALKELLSFVFPKYPPGAGGSDRDYIARPQSLFVNRYADYWARYLAPSSIPDAECDQKALIAIRDWRSGQPSDLIERVVDPHKAKQVIQFVGQFSPVELCRLLSDVCERLKTQSAKEWEHQANAPGVAAVWCMLQDRPAPESKIFETVVEIIRRFLPEHLPLAYDVAHFFVKPSPSIPALMSNEQRTEAAGALRDAITASFLGDGAEQRLLQAFKDGSPWLVSWVSWFAPPINGESGPIPFAQWPEFANVLLNVAEAQPAIGVPMVVPFVTRSNMATGYKERESGELERVGRWIGQFDAETAKRLFEFARLIRILRSFDVPDTLDPQITAHCHAAVEAARALTSLPQQSAAPAPPDSRTSVA
jgi:hypothetical protein